MRRGSRRFAAGSGRASICESMRTARGERRTLGRRSNRWLQSRISCIEQPLRTRSSAHLPSSVKQIAVPIMLDESLTSLVDAEAAVAAGRLRSVQHSALEVRRFSRQLATGGVRTSRTGSATSSAAIRASRASSLPPADIGRRASPTFAISKVRTTAICFAGSSRTKTSRSATAAALRRSPLRASALRSIQLDSRHSPRPSADSPIA